MKAKYVAVTSLLQNFDKRHTKLNACMHENKTCVAMASNMPRRHKVRVTRYLGQTVL